MPDAPLPEDGFAVPVQAFKNIREMFTEDTVLEALHQGEMVSTVPAAALPPSSMQDQPTAASILESRMRRGSILRIVANVAVCFLRSWENRDGQLIVAVLRLRAQRNCRNHALNEETQCWRFAGTLLHTMQASDLTKATVTPMTLAPRLLGDKDLKLRLSNACYAELRSLATQRHGVDVVAPWTVATLTALNAEGCVLTLQEARALRTLFARKLFWFTTEDGSSMLPDCIKCMKCKEAGAVVPCQISELHVWSKMGVGSDRLFRAVVPRLSCSRQECSWTIGVVDPVFMRLLPGGVTPTFQWDRVHDRI